MVGFFHRKDVHRRGTAIIFGREGMESCATNGGIDSSQLLMSCWFPFEPEMSGSGASPTLGAKSKRSSAQPKLPPKKRRNPSNPSVCRGKSFERTPPFWLRNQVGSIDLVNSDDLSVLGTLNQTVTGTLIRGRELSPPKIQEKTKPTSASLPHRPKKIMLRAFPTEK